MMYHLMQKSFTPFLPCPQNAYAAHSPLLPEICMKFDLTVHSTSKKHVRPLPLTAQPSVAVPTHTPMKLQNTPPVAALKPVSVKCK
jgi:hypothetical protein